LVAKALIESALEINTIGSGRSIDWPNVLAIAANKNWEEFELEKENNSNNNNNNNNNKSDNNGGSSSKSDNNSIGSKLEGNKLEEGNNSSNWSDLV
jgi:hypothetical protein